MITRRQFLKTLEAIALTPLLGCAKQQKPWQPPFECSYLEDRNSSLNLIYLPDEHHLEYQEPMIKFLEAHLQVFDALSLEGLSGHLTPEYKKELEQARKEIDLFNQERDELIEKCKATNETEGFGFSLYLSMAFAEPFFKNLPPRKSPSYIHTSPGLDYALYFSGKIKIFGFEDLQAYEQSQAITRAYQYFLLEKNYEEAKKDPQKSAKTLQIIEEYFDLEQIRQGRKFLEKYGITKETIKKAYTPFNEKREQAALRNILKYTPRGTVAMIMGRAHQENICTEAEKHSLSFAVAKLPF